MVVAEDSVAAIRRFIPRRRRGDERGRRGVRRGRIAGGGAGSGTAAGVVSDANESARSNVAAGGAVVTEIAVLRGAGGTRADRGRSAPGLSALDALLRI